MKKVIIFLFFAISIAESKAQTSNLYWGAIEEDKHNREIVDIYPALNGNIIITKANIRNYEELILEEFSQDSLKLLNKNQQKIPEVKNMQPKYYGALHLRQNSIIICTAEDRNNNKTYILGFPLSPDLNLASEPKTLGIIETVDQKDNVLFDLYTSTDNNSFVLLIPTSFDDQQNEKFELRNFDYLMNLSYSKELEFPYPANKLLFEDLLLDGDSAVYMLISEEADHFSNKKSDTRKARNYKLASFFTKENRMIELELSLGLKWVYDARLSITQTGALQVAGYYSNYTDLILSGTFALNINRSTQEIETQGLKPFSRDFKTQFRPSSGVVDERELGYFQFDKIYNLPNGNTQLICEKRYSYTSTVYNPATGTYMVVTVYRSDNLIITEIDEKGDIVFNLNIPKFQASSRDFGLYTSYSSFRRDNKTYFLYNDNEQNSGSNDKFREMNSADDSDAVLVEIDKDGTVNKTILYNHAKEQTVLRPEYYLPTPDGIVLYTQSSKKFRLARLSLEKAEKDNSDSN